MEKVAHAKVVLLGGSGIGKTCIISQYVSGIFDKNRPPTAVASFCSKMIEINNKSITLDICDSMGGESYRSMNKFYIKDADAIILVYDITSEHDFEYLQNYWELYIHPNIPKNTSKKKYFFI